MLIGLAMASAAYDALAQGSLTPPGGPGPTMKTLSQVEPRYPISTYGTNLTQSGSYYLTTNLVSSTTSGSAISISADNVTLDLNGFALINTGGAGTSAVGIQLSGVDDVTIRNGTIRGFLRGIYSPSLAAATTIENMRLATNYLRGILLAVGGGLPGTVVRNNVVYSTGGTTVGVADQDVRAIEVVSSMAIIENNFVADVKGKGTGAAYGIYTAGSLDAFVVNNRVSQANYGIRMNAPNEYRDNMTSTCDTNYVGGVDRGNNF